jgi:hypothetical protein
MFKIVRDLLRGRLNGREGIIITNFENSTNFSEILFIKVFLKKKSSPVRHNRGDMMLYRNGSYKFFSIESIRARAEPIRAPHGVVFPESPRLATSADRSNRTSFDPHPMRQCPPLRRSTLVPPRSHSGSVHTGLRVLAYVVPHGSDLKI